MNVLSLFDGMSCGQLAFEKLGIEVENYYASEIKKHAIKHVKSKFENTIHLGNVKNIHYNIDRFEIKNEESSNELPPSKIDILIGGSPCKGISRLNQKQQGLEHKESILFWEYLRLYKECKPKYFLLENTPGQETAIKTITKELGVRPIKLNADLVSCQNRLRYYWTNIPVIDIPKDKNLTSERIINNEFTEDLIVKDGKLNWLLGESGQRSIEKKFTRINPYPKFACLTAGGYKKWNCNYIFKEGVYRHLSINECEELQGVKKDYLSGLSYGEAYDLLGDGWNVDIISHILSFAKFN